MVHVYTYIYIYIYVYIYKMHRHVGAMRDIIANTIQYSGASMGRLRQWNGFC